MIANFTAEGVLTLKAESALEAFALKAWEGEATRTGEGYPVRVEPGLFSPRAPAEAAQ